MEPTTTKRLTVDNAAELATDFIETIPEYPSTYTGRGIVICAGGIRYSTCAWVLICMLRELGCELPIEVWYLGEDEGDPSWLKLVEPMGVTCHNALEQAPGVVPAFHLHKGKHPRYSGWALKSFAIVHSRFEEVLFIDADSIPVVNPEYLFDSPEYRQTGAVFWPDPEGVKTIEASQRWNVFGISYRDEPEQESGQLLIHKQTCWRSLLLCNWYNAGAEFFYKYVYGDKDTFRFAWHRMGQRFAMPAHYPKRIPYTLCQRDFDGDVVFQHRVGDKWSLVGNRRSLGFEHEEKCVSLVKELRARWNPTAFLTKNQSEQDKLLAGRIAGQSFEYRRLGHNRWNMSLGSDGYVSQGQSPCESFWWCEEGKLVLADANGKPSVRMARKADGSWQGQSIPNPRMQLNLRTRTCAETSDRGLATPTA